MDKPNANQLLEAINCFEHVSTSKTAMISDRSEARQLLLKAITAHGEAMAAWGAAQEREKHKRVDWRGLALDLEQQAAFSRSQTAERAMLAAARGLRLMGASE